jgi:uncharacterized protein involved in exopolysaccharide biosynthesis
MSVIDGKNIDENLTTVDFTPLFKRVRSKAWLVCSVAVITVIVGILKMTTESPIWEAKTVIVFPSRSAGASGAAALLGSSNTRDIINMFGEILRSQNLIDKLALQTKLDKSQLRNTITVKEKALMSTIELTVTDSDKKRVAKISQSAIDALRSIVKDLNIPSAEQELKIVQDELVKKTAELNHAEVLLQKFLENATTAPSVSLSPSGATSISTTQWANQENKLKLDLIATESAIKKIMLQARELNTHSEGIPTGIGVIDEWRNKLVSLQYDLKVKQISLGDASPEIVRLKEQIRVAEEQLKSEISSNYKSAQLGVANNLSELMIKKAATQGELQGIQKITKLAPKEAMEYQRLSREVAILSQAIQELRVKSESTKFLISRDPNNWSVLDNAVVSDKPTNKSFVKRAVVSCFVGLILGVVLALLFSRTPKKSNYQV